MKGKLRAVGLNELLCCGLASNRFHEFIYCEIGRTEETP
jgi:hypothetical protein